VVSAYVALALLTLIGLFTNLFFFQRFSTALVTPEAHTLGPWVILVPVAGALAIGVIARYGSERIRGHGMPEAIEAILINGSRIDPKVALLKPLSSAISIGSGGPFGAEGPIIMTGGAVGSLIAQTFHLSASERKALLVAGAAGGMSATFATPVAAVMLAVELLLFEFSPRSLVPLVVSASVAAGMHAALFGPGPLFHVPPHEYAGLDSLWVFAVLGVACGALQFQGSRESDQTEGIYWKYECMLRLLESRLGINLQEKPFLWLPGMGEFKDYGPFDGTEWAGYKGLPKGNWVYVYPHWYIWEKKNK
jgi:H+/Cl- antiporter ClcA